MITIAVANQKGGVGKTTSTFHLARAAARRDLRTLVVDLDPQSNASAVRWDSVTYPLDILGRSQQQRSQQLGFSHLSP